MQITLINCHPREGSLSDALAQTYAETAQELGAKVRIIAVRDLKFNPVIDPTLVSDLEPDLKMAQESILWCNHLCLVFPTWWTGLPALGKGFIDRVFQSGFAFRYRGSGFPDKLLTGRSARIIHTMAAPALYNSLAVGKPQIRMIKDGTLGFCGIKPVRVTTLDGMKKNGPQRPEYLEQARAAARYDISKKPSN